MILKLPLTRERIELARLLPREAGLLIRHHNPGGGGSIRKLFFFFPHAAGWKWMLRRQSTRRGWEKGTTKDQTALWVQGRAERPTLKKKKRKNIQALDKTQILSISAPSRIYQFRDDKSNLTAPRQTGCLGMCKADHLAILPFGN